MRRRSIARKHGEEDERFRLRGPAWTTLLAVVALCATGCGTGDEMPQASKPDATSKPVSDADGSQTNAANRRVMLLAAASTADAVQEVAGLFESKSGAKVEISTGASNALAQQIIAGAPADVFLSANEKWAEELQKKGFSDAARPLLGNRLVIVVPRGNPAAVKEPADLSADAVKKIALAGENVPAGSYADQALRSLKLFEQLTEAGRIVRGQDVRVTLGYVERGECEAGIVYATDAKVSDKVEAVYNFDPAVHDALVYPAVLVQREGAVAVGREFFEFLFSAEAADVFRRHGFLPVSEPAARSKAATGEP